MSAEEDHFERPTLLIVDDDEVFARVLAAAFERRGYLVRVGHSVEVGIALARAESPEFAVVDLRMPGGSGLELVQALQQQDENTRIVVLTGYASIATAVEAIKLGAVHYLAKPADADEIQAAFYRDEGNAEVGVPERPLSVGRLEWEHIQRVLQECDGNVSATARRLGMHRRTLQRKLQKRPLRS
ncbi:MAG: response regulator transcription factor [Gammaproteobacteria bacterium]|nr:MAG: response regulator transcription factor [Gammaproteobacteria bacterium]